MKITSVLRLMAIASVVLSVLACGSPREAEESNQTSATVVATAISPTSTAIAADPSLAGQTPVAATATPALSLAEQSRARKPAITKALATMVLPEEGNIVASVNGEAITVDELTAYMRLRMDGIASQYGLDWASEETLAYVGQVQSEVIEQLIEMRLISQGAKRDGIVVDDAELEGMAHEVQQSILEGQGYDSWQDYLDTVGISDQQFRDILTQSLLVNGVILAQATPAEAEQVHARHILVTDPDLAADLVSQLAAGADFAELAKAHSEDTGTAQNGGDLDWFPRGMMVSEFEDAAFSLQVGDVSGVVTTTYGYHIIQVLEAGKHALSEASRQQLQQIAFMDWLDALRAEADIQRYVLIGVG